MEGTAFFPLPEGLRITEIHREEAALTVKVLSERASARYPLCGEESAEAHSRRPSFHHVKNGDQQEILPMNITTRADWQRSKNGLIP